MRRISRMVSVDFDRSIGLNNDGVYTNDSWYDIGYIWTGDFGVNYYKAVLKIKNVGLPMDSEAIITIVFRNNNLFLSTDAPINHGSLIGKKANSGQFFKLYFNPDINFLGTRIEIEILDESGDLCRMTYKTTPVQGIKVNTSFNEISLNFIPDGKYCVPINKIKTTDIVSTKLAPCFSITPVEEGSTDGLLEFSTNFLIKNYEYVTFDIAAKISQGVYIKNPCNNFSVYQSQSSFYYINDTANKKITIYSSIGYEYGSDTLIYPNTFSFKTIQCSIVSEAGSPLIDRSTATAIPVEGLVV